MPQKSKNINRPAAKGSISSALEAKVASHIRKLETAADASSPPLTVTYIYNQIQAVDPGLRRNTKLALERIIEKVLPIVREEFAQDDEEDRDEIDSEFEGLDDSRLIDYKGTNSMNKSVTSLWGIPPAPAIKTPISRQASVDPEANPEVVDLTIPDAPSTTPAPEAASAAPAKSAKRKERPSAREPGSSAKRQKVDQDRAAPTNVSLSDLGGVDDCVNELLELIAMPLTHPEVYVHTGIQPPRGVLLHGPPGCGKTLLANAIAGELGVPFINMSAVEVVSGMSGESEKKLRDVFEEAKALAPCIMFLDEIDAITPKRENAQREMEKRIVTQLLTCMDSLSFEATGHKPVLIIGATNRPDSLDPALRRAGRFDREIQLSVPDEVGREKILKVMSRKLRLDGDFDYKALARMTPGFVGADLRALTGAAGVVAIKRIFKELSEKPEDEQDKVQEVLEEAGYVGNNDVEMTEDVMEVDGEIAAEAAAEEQVPSTEETPASAQTEVRDPQADAKAKALKTLNTIHSFLSSHPKTLTPAELEPLAITLQDFLIALPKIQPSSKREGFATVPDVTWADVGALEGTRIELQMAIVQPIKRPELYESVGITAPAGVLLWGPPGCGKTLLAKAVANESRANFISVRGPELLNKYVGESERSVRQVFMRARASSPCVIFFDELDALVPRRDDSLSESSARVVNTLLTELDGLNDRKGVFVIAATNRPDIIDPAMMRPGRLDKPLFVELPTPGERAEILKTLTKKTPIAPEVDLVAISNDPRAENFSGADLASLVREAAVGALRNTVLTDLQSMEVSEDPLVASAARQVEGLQMQKKQIQVTQKDFENAFRNVRPSVSSKERQKYETLARKWGKPKSGTGEQ
ncbi:AAA-domain-containing protein [Saitoella complicata NRRL Y-17804]|uniref:AAA-domain-containing protein n=1 Tax=Saitoella complicata (strain BCRC 22490 / CBS 7301 / JCM 7358 / NBRC 10748 / NRRL Y-17804) TaxID=698492 RepID=UPI000866BA1F|nr:AAA-domain-containing protein [Saitoella complicata NRRL Y-17804]ODQ54226.1 AAA-domain-containing protein [Saitoella complicata NRRL Y-17804]